VPKSRYRYLDTVNNYRKHLLATPGQGFARLMETQPREPVIAAGLRRGRSGSGGEGNGWEGEALLHLVSWRRPLGEDFRRYPGGRRTAPRRSSIASRLTPLSCACPAATPSYPFFPRPFRRPDSQPKCRRDEGGRGGEKGAQNSHGFFTQRPAVEQSV